MFDNLLDKFNRKIYELDKSMNYEEGKDTPDFDTWMKKIKEEKSLKDRLKDEFGPGKNPKKAKKLSRKEISRPSKADQDELKRRLERKYARGLREYENKSYQDKSKDDEKNKIKDELRSDGLKKAVIYKEILSKPKGRR